MPSDDTLTRGTFPGLGSASSTPHPFLSPRHKKKTPGNVAGIHKTPKSAPRTPGRISAVTPKGLGGGSPKSPRWTPGRGGLARRKTGDSGVLGTLTPGKSSKSGKKTYDRFITSHASMSMPTSQYNLSRSSGTQNAPPDPTYTEELAKACGVALNNRILSFNSEPPPSDHVANPSAAWSRPLRPTVQAKGRRTVATLPERVLDAPGMVDDYYLNLVDWSSGNQVAIVLGRTVYLWSGDTGDVTEFLTAPPTDSITSVSFTTDGSYLAVGTHEGDTQIWDVETGGKVRSMGGHAGRVGVLGWMGHLLSSGCRDGSIHNHDVRIANHKIAELLAHTSEVCGLKWRPDGAFLASGGNDNLVNIWDARGNTPRWTKREHNAAVKALAWCPWQPHLLATGGGTHDRHIHFWNVSTGAKLSSLDTGSQVTSLHWSREYKEILSSHGFPDNQMTLWTYPAMQKVADLQGHDARVLHTSASPDGTMVASAAGDEALKIWKVWEKRPNKEVQAELPGGGAAGNVDSLAGAFERKATIR